jgi:hypothetical protein
MISLITESKSGMWTREYVLSWRCENNGGDIPILEQIINISHNL